jgi:hypothetical protein
VGTFSPGVPVTLAVRASEGAYVATGNHVYYSGWHTSVLEVRSSQGAYVATGSHVFYLGHHTTVLQVHTGGTCFGYATKIFRESAHVYLTGLPFSRGDGSHFTDSVGIVFGVSVNFIAYERYGRAPFAAYFYQKCRGPVREFYWEFYDNNRSYYSDPVNIYKKSGYYDVSLRIRIGNRYYTEYKREYILVLPGGLIVSRTTKHIRHATKKEHGIGFYEMPTENMPMPEARTGTLLVYDDNDQVHGLVLDFETGLWFDTTTRDGPEGSGLTKSWANKNGSLDITREVHFAEDIGESESDRLKHIASRIPIRPYKETDRNSTGYDENGFLDGMEIDLNFYVDGDPTTATTKIRKIPQGGDLKTDKKVEGHRIKLGIVSNRGSHSILQREQVYSSDKFKFPIDKRISNEMTYQGELSPDLFWLSYVGSDLIDRISGQVIDVASVGQVTGPGGVASVAQEFTGAKTFKASIALSSGYILLWADSTPAITIGGAPVTLTAFDDDAGWTLYYASGITATGALVITHSGMDSICDLRIFSTGPTVDAVQYYFEDIISNAGSIVFP